MEQSQVIADILGLTLSVEWDKDQTERAYLNDYWMDYAGWTLPHVYPDDTLHNQTEQQHDFQSLGAQVVNHLANKITTVLFNPGRPFYRLDLSDEQLEQLIAAGVERAGVDELLAKAEKEGMKELTRAKLRTAVLTVIKSLIITGNSMLYFPDNKSNLITSQVYSVKDYVVRRDMSGGVTKMITRDTHAIVTLPDDIREMALANHDKIADTDKVNIFTGIMRTKAGKFIVWQELEGIARIPRRVGEYTEKDLPWIPLTWNLSRGRNYGTGLVEEYAGDFHVYSAMAEAMLNLSVLASDIKILVNPMGNTDVDALNESTSGTYVYGSGDDISFLQLEKLQDARFILEQMEVYARRIGAGFLFNAAVTRDAERVTAEEIRMQANELEGSLGGVYSRLAEEMQLPIARKVMQRVGAEFKDVEPIITTGVESLSRTTELDQIMLFFADLARLSDLPPEAAKRLNYQGIISKLGAARQVEYREFLLAEDIVQANDEKQAALEAQTAAASRPQPQQQEELI